MQFPDPNRIHPIPGHERVVLLRPLITNPLISVGEYTYYDDPDHATEFESRNVTHHYGPDRLEIGRFCALAAGVRFVMNGANHRMTGVSTYPFPIMGPPWDQHMDLVTDLPSRGNTVVGNDVWIGGNTTVMPGVRIGDGAVIAFGSVVTNDVGPYEIHGGNPSRLIRARFSPDQIAELLKIAWWNWPSALITKHLRTIADGDVERLHSIAEAGFRDRS